MTESLSHKENTDSINTTEVTNDQQELTHSHWDDLVGYLIHELQLDISNIKDGIASPDTKELYMSAFEHKEKSKPSLELVLSTKVKQSNVRLHKELSETIELQFAKDFILSIFVAMKNSTFRFSRMAFGGFSSNFNIWVEAIDNDEQSIDTFIDLVAKLNHEYQSNKCRVIARIYQVRDNMNPPANYYLIS